MIAGDAACLRHDAASPASTTRRRYRSGHAGAMRAPALSTLSFYPQAQCLWSTGLVGLFLVFLLPFVVGHAVDRLARLRIGQFQALLFGRIRDTSATGSCGKSRRDSSDRDSAHPCARADARPACGTRRLRARCGSCRRIPCSSFLGRRAAPPAAPANRSKYGVPIGRLPHRGRASPGSAASSRASRSAHSAAPASVGDQILAQLDRDMRQAARRKRDGAACSRPARAPNRAGCRRPTWDRARHAGRPAAASRCGRRSSHSTPTCQGRAKPFIARRETMDRDAPPAPRPPRSDARESRHRSPRDRARRASACALAPRRADRVPRLPGIAMPSLSPRDRARIVGRAVAIDDEPRIPREHRRAHRASRASRRVTAAAPMSQPICCATVPSR